MVADHFEALAAYDRREFLDYPRENGVARAAIDVMVSHLERGTPLALPPEVAEICNSDGFASLRCMPDACEACRYPLPYRRRATWGGGRVEPEVHYFERCPLCGGPVGRMPWRG